MGVGEGDRQSDSGTTSLRDSNGATAPLGLSTGTETATGDGRRATTNFTCGGAYLLQNKGAHPDSCCHQHTITGRGEAGQLPIGLIHRASPHQPNVWACAAAATTPTTVAYHAADIATDGIRVTPLQPAPRGQSINYLYSLPQPHRSKNRSLRRHPNGFQLPLHTPGHP